MGSLRVLLQERERKGDDLKYKAVVWVVDGDQLVRCSSTHLRPVSTAEQTLCSLRDGEARTFQQVVQELAKRKFVDLVGQPSPVEEDFEEPMNVASSDHELHEDFFSGEELASAPDDSEVPKDPQMTYQTRSASSHAKTPAAVSPESTQAPFIPKVELSSSTARTEHGILAAEDLRWLPKQRSREVRYPKTCWNPDATEKRGPVLTFLCKG